MFLNFYFKKSNTFLPFSQSPDKYVSANLKPLNKIYFCCKTRYLQKYDLGLFSI